jgi:putative endonuclease
MPARSREAGEEGRVEGSMHAKEKWYFIYIMSNRSKTLYTGITGNFRKRVWEHKTGAFEGFTKRYKIDRLVYWEKFKRVQLAITREKQLKRWTRVKKMRLIVSVNPTWKDLAEDWFPELKEQPST